MIVADGGKSACGLGQVLEVVGRREPHHPSPRQAPVSHFGVPFPTEKSCQERDFPLVPMVPEVYDPVAGDLMLSLGLETNGHHEDEGARRKPPVEAV